MKFIKYKKQPLYPLNPWQIAENKYSAKNNLLSETIFSISNGYIGIRGSFEEGLAGNSTRSIDGIYLNGFFESVPIPHGERGYGFAENTQTMLNVTDSKIITLYLENERFSIDSGTLLKFNRTLNMREGYQTRSVYWKSPNGREIKIRITRMVSFTHRHLLAFRYEVEPVNFSGKITIYSSLNGDVDNHTHEEYDPRFSASLGDLCLAVTGLSVKDTRATITQKTRRSQLTLACSMENKIHGSTVQTVNGRQTEKIASTRFQIDAREKETVTLEKYVAYYTSRDYPEEKLAGLAEDMVNKAANLGFSKLLAEQKDHCERYWEKVGISIDGDPKCEQGLRFNLFNLLQASGNDGQTSIAAKGLSSEGYDGHYFWDTEIYMLPFYATVLPEEARKLIEYRYSILEHARSRARELSHPSGALYPWRTIAGEEGSSYFPASTAQYHINAAIAYAVKKYVETTGDFSLMLDYGAEIIFETARLWEDLGTYIPRKGNRFCFNEVTGPDEYSALVSNNCYTNLMAQWHLRFAYDTACYLKQAYKEDYRRIKKKIKLQDKELQSWLLASEYTYIPFDEAMQILPQDDGFLDKETWNFAKTPADNYPLLLHYHPLVIYRFQVCKQPDVILAHYLLCDRFSIEQKRRDYNYYEPITTHDSSLSPSIFSVISSELGYYEDAYRFFYVSARMDLDNIMKSTPYGIHMANMSGSWLCLVHGFAGMRIIADELSFKPYLPPKLKSYSFKINFKGSCLKITVKGKRANYRLLEGDKAEFIHESEKVTLLEGESKDFNLQERPPQE